MPYTITSRDGSVSVTIPDGTLDNTTSLKLPGPNYVGYGQFLNENLFRLLENFSSNSAPTGTNLQGQLWFDKGAQSLKVYTATGYVAVSGVTNSSLEPGPSTGVVPKDGDFWFNQFTNQLNVYDSGAFKIVGPGYTRAQGPSGAIPTSILDAVFSGLQRNVVKLQYGNVIVATVSENTFTPSGFDIGFPLIRAGITFNSNISATMNSNLIGSVTGNVTGNLAGNVVATTLSGTLTGSVIGNVTGNVVATTLSGDLTGNVVSTRGQITNLTSSNVAISGGQITNLTELTATNGQVTNLVSSNVLISGGTISANGMLATTLVATNFSTANARVTGGYITSLANISATSGIFTNTTSTSLVASNFSTANAVVTGGRISGLASLSAATTQTDNFSSANAQISGGSIVGMTLVNGITAIIDTINSSNVQITGGNTSNTTGANVTLSSSVLNNSTATTVANVYNSSSSIATTSFIHSVMPKGIIVMWNSTSATIPVGWQLCNGTNGTPNLVDRFIVGVGNSYVFGDTGGSADVTLNANALPVHSHAVSLSGTTGSAGSHSHTITDPGHQHSGVVQNYNNNINWNGTGGAVANTGGGLTQIATTGIGISATTDHTHSVALSGNTQSTGGTSGTTQPHENRPPYYALCYIQKMT